MKQLINMLAFALFLLCVPANVSAVGAYPFPLEVKQPNGETIVIQMHGDENFHYYTTQDGVLIAYDTTSGYYTYAVINGGVIKPGTIKVSNSKLRSSVAGLIRSDSKEFQENVKQPALAKVIAEKLENRKKGVALRSATAVTGNIKRLVILANFKDVKFTEAESRLAFTRMLNQKGYSDNGGTGSARDFYMNNSVNAYTPDFDVYGPVDLPNNMSFYGENDASGNDKNAQQMIIDACNAANAQYPNLNFADYDTNKDGVLDNVFVFYAGYGEAEANNMPNTIWPHNSQINTTVSIDGVKLYSYACSSEFKKNSGAKMTGIGTFIHESSHLLGLPDLYDADGSENGSGVGVGAWCTMGSGMYLNEGRTPPNFCVMERYLLGWMDQLTELIPTDALKQISIAPLSSSNSAYFLKTSVDGDFYTFETRKKEGWDTYLPGEGMLVFHTDISGSLNKTFKLNDIYYSISGYELWDIGYPNVLATHQCFDLLRANKNSDNASIAYQGNPYPGSTNASLLCDYTDVGLVSWNVEQSKVILSGINRNQSTGVVSFSFSKSSSANFYDLVARDTKKITQNSAELNASITKQGNFTITQRGFCWNKVGNPSSNENPIVVSGTGIGAFSANLNNLSPDNTYFVRPYIKTSNNETLYGGTSSFKTVSSVKNTPFKESFPFGKLMNWNMIDNNKDYYGWYYNKILKNDVKIGAAVIDGNDNAANDWLVSPPISIPAGYGNMNLTYDVAVSSDQIMDVGISETYPDPEAFSTITNSTNNSYKYTGNGAADNFSWFSSALSIPSSPADRKIYIAFINKTNKGKALYLTNIQLTGNPTGIEEQTAVSLPVVYSTDGYIYFNNIAQSYEVNIFDVSGRLYQQATISANTSLDVNHSGVYVVKLKNGTQNYTYKVVVK